MRNLRYFFLLPAMVLAALVSCNGGNKIAVAPSQVALELYNGLTSGNVEAVTGNIHFEDSLDYNLFRDYFKMAVASDDYKQRTKDFKSNYKVVSEKIDGDVAVVALEGVGPLGNNLKINVRLVAVNGSWKVDGNHGVFHGDFSEDGE